MADVYISYRQEDEAVVRTVAGDIEALGHRVWFDSTHAGGEPWWDRILAEIRRCNVFVVALTPSAPTSQSSQVELAYARDLGKVVFPVVVVEDAADKTLAPALAKIPFVDYSRDDRRTGIEFAKAFLSLPDSAPLPQPLPPDPDIPICHLGELERQISSASVLSYERQCVLLLRLRRSLKDPATSQEARILLTRLRGRIELLAEAAEEADELLAQQPAVWPTSESGTVRAAASGEERPQRPAEERRSSQPTRKTTRQSGNARPQVHPMGKAAGIATEPDVEGVFVDPDTDLMWTVRDNGQHVDWFVASDYAESLRLGGYTDWRLPTAEELQSLYDPESSGEFKAKYPIQLGHRFVWGSKKKGSASASSFDFSYGTLRSSYADETHLCVLCVRALT